MRQRHSPPRKRTRRREGLFFDPICRQAARTRMLLTSGQTGQIQTKVLSAELMAGARKPIEAVSNPSIPTTRKHSTTMVIWKAVKPRLLISPETLTIELACMFHPISVCVVPILDERDSRPKGCTRHVSFSLADGSCALDFVSRRACFSGVDGAGCRNGIFGKTAPAIEPGHGVVHLILALGSQHGIAKLGV